MIKINHIDNKEERAMFSINVFQLADLVQKFRNTDFSEVTQKQAIEWMHEQMMHLPVDERDTIASEAWKEHVNKQSRIN